MKETLLKQFDDIEIQEIKPFGIQINAGAVTNTLDSLGRDTLVALAEVYKLVLLRGFSSLDRSAFLQFCAKDPDTELLHWNVGPVMELKVDENTENYLFSTEKVPFHWDGAFYVAPSFLVFNCIQAPMPGYGGETLFCNMEMIWKNASPENRALWEKIELIYETEKKAHYGGRIQVAMVQKHPHTGEAVLRYNEPVETELNPVTLDIKGLPKEQHPEFIETMKKLLYSEAYCVQQQWEKGDFLIADNHTLVHGRNAFTQNTPRHLMRVQIR